MTPLEVGERHALPLPLNTRAALRYFGGKASLAPWIIGHFPPHEVYVEPYCGGASCFQQKAPAKVEVLNDLDGEVVAFWRVLRDRPDDFIRAIECTPFARAEVQQAFAKEDPGNDFERARRLYVRSWQTIHGAPAKQMLGWRCEREDGGNALAWIKTDHLRAIALRLRRVQIEHDDALTVIGRYDGPNALHFIDPPYLTETRRKRWRKDGYQVETTDEHHVELANVLHGIRGAAVLAGYASDLYRDLYADWQMVTRAAVIQSGEAATECLWLNDRAASASRQQSLDLGVSA